MKDKESFFIYNSEATIENDGILNIITPKEQPFHVIQPKERPFHVNFSYEDKWIEIQLVNGSDVFKLADIFAEMLKKNNIDYSIFKSEN